MLRLKALLQRILPSAVPSSSASALRSSPTLPAPPTYVRTAPASSYPAAAAAQPHKHPRVHFPSLLAAALEPIPHRVRPVVVMTSRTASWPLHQRFLHSLPASALAAEPATTSSSSSLPKDAILPQAISQTSDKGASGTCAAAALDHAQASSSSTSNAAARSSSSSSASSDNATLPVDMHVTAAPTSSEEVDERTVVATVAMRLEEGIDGEASFTRDSHGHLTMRPSDPLAPWEREKLVGKSTTTSPDEAIAIHEAHEHETFLSESEPEPATASSGSSVQHGLHPLEGFQANRAPSVEETESQTLANEGNRAMSAEEVLEQDGAPTGVRSDHKVPTLGL
ncbi:hypothetical protein CAOG_05539 [Capsaspora owczarzaki ATCC 30864]|uniref:Uncharacterized protein n=1 Tax=Capsaspora owczarzaki (strain ATCC 30864) TaxID=595528 RepID=A0A0D2X3W3_CAPO3|nr:hypothetical protein CAOG_05539 [Capsaspora owczarzaki ATCC 30864]KJE95009.1 hypothetical protein CAOG_005539 [Capsaspora owczarzaki ATCC 30864]|eukprot:XP_004346212.1 hypothetical protein CAOG_05539 [Capsaspora owczarzaki ATCC 30864]